jgi:predicted membrane-bound spermidine synthase
MSTIENNLQICSIYRLHYHKFFVHFPAQYLKKIENKEVIFISGGDDALVLLHKVLKYSDLVKVVGLELDKQVMRESFKYFDPSHILMIIMLNGGTEMPQRGVPRCCQRNSGACLTW